MMHFAGFLLLVQLQQGGGLSYRVPSGWDQAPEGAQGVVVLRPRAALSTIRRRPPEWVMGLMGVVLVVILYPGEGIIYDQYFLVPELALLQGHMGEVNSVAWSPDGSRVVTASLDRTARHIGQPSPRDGTRRRSIDRSRPVTIPAAAGTRQCHDCLGGQRRLHHSDVGYS